MTRTKAILAAIAAASVMTGAGAIAQDTSEAAPAAEIEQRFDAMAAAFDTEITVGMAAEYDEVSARLDETYDVGSVFASRLTEEEADRVVIDAYAANTY